MTRNHHYSLNIPANAIKHQRYDQLGKAPKRTKRNIPDTYIEKHLQNDGGHNACTFNAHLGLTEQLDCSTYGKLHVKAQGVGKLYHVCSGDVRHTRQGHERNKPHMTCADLSLQPRCHGGCCHGCCNSGSAALGCVSAYPCTTSTHARAKTSFRGKQCPSLIILCPTFVHQKQPQRLRNS